MAVDETPVAFTVAITDHVEATAPLCTTVDGQQILLVFSTAERAKLFLENSGMTEGLRTESMSLGDFFRWTVPAYEQGTELASVDWSGQDEELIVQDLEAVLRNTVEQLLAPVEAS